MGEEHGEKVQGVKEGEWPAEALGPLLTPRLNKYIPHEPTDKQAALLLLDNREILYGGAAGGAKSDALLMAALQYVEEPGYKAILFRKTFADLSLPEALMDRAFEWLGGTDAKWDGTNKTWRFPSGATLSFGYLDNKNDVYRYQGAAFHFIGIDEVTQIRPFDFRYLFSRQRRLAGVQIPLRYWCAGNPGGEHHEFYLNRFRPDKIGNREAMMYQGRIFIPSKLKDNPYIDAKSYIESLMHLDPITRRQLLDGDWTARHGGSIFKREWFKVVPELPSNCLQVRGWDLAASEDEEAARTAGVKLARDGQRIYYIAHCVSGRWTPGKRDNVIRQTAMADTKSVRVFLEEEGGSGGKAQVEALTRFLPEFWVRGIKPTGDKVTRAGPVASAAEIGNVRIVDGPWVQEFLDRLESFSDEINVDEVDALSLAYNELVEIRTARPPVLKEKDDEQVRRERLAKLADPGDGLASPY